MYLMLPVLTADVFVGSVRNPEDPDAVNETVVVDDSVEGVHAAVS